jgi:hypothetical protein
MTDSWHISFGPCDSNNPGFGYYVKVERNGVRLLYTASDPVSGKPLDYAECLRVASMYGPKR